MITRCRFCSFQKESPLSRDILELLVSDDLPPEDYLLWLKRLITQFGNQDYHSIQDHMEVRHPDFVYRGILPDNDYSDWEADYMAVINGRMAELELDGELLAGLF